MEIITLTVLRQTISTNKKWLVRDTVESYKCKFIFNETWDNLIKTAVFKSSDGTLKEMIVEDDECIIPWENLNEEGTLTIGVYGSLGTQTYPTLWTSPIPVRVGSIDGDPHIPPTPDVYQQLLEKYNQTNQKIDEEITRAETKEDELDTKIDEETTNRILADEELARAIQTEVNRASDKEDELEIKINEVQSNLDNETQRAIARENEIESKCASDNEELKELIEQEENRAKGIESNLANAIIQEMQARVSHDNALTKKIEDETTRAITKENELDERLVNEVDIRKEQFTNLSTNLTLEIQNRINSDTILTQAINSEKLRAEGVEQELAGALSDEVNRAEAQEEDIRNNIESTKRTLQIEINKAGHKVELNLDSSYKLKAILKDKNNNTISTSTEVDLPIESVVVSGRYDSVTKEVVLTLVDGSEIRFSVADLIDGLVSENEFNSKITELENTISNLNTKLENLVKELTPPNGYAYLLVKKGD